MTRPRTQPAPDLLARMSGLTSEALHRLADLPGGTRLVEMANESKQRLDEMQKKLRGLDELEKRVARLEKQVAAQAKATATPAARKPAARAAAKKPAAGTAAKKPPSSSG